ncbi:unnamed protein product [Phyllotreta striolata]|uniref:Biogenesis of lysosome-related organelles complex 1 subunit 3 n=1 Tax=Phyllotreta striolata TaxID=444603 RepID=A0A9N9T9J0_PHYSR|nr:unnamed protein product [Phyllotreta striolata]
MNKSIVVTGEASETDSEDEFKDVTLNSSMTKSVQGAVIPGEDSESDNEIDASVASATSALTQCQFVANNDPKFDSLFHLKLRECNEHLHSNIENVCQSTINDAARHLSVIDQHLVRSETNVENSVTAVKSLSISSLNIKSKLHSLLSSNFLANLKGSKE